MIRWTGAETGGRLLVFDLFLPPGAHVPAPHVHPAQEEVFTVLAGRMRSRIGRQTLLAGPRDRVTVPPDTVHWFGNTGTEAAHARVEVSPAQWQMVWARGSWGARSGSRRSCCVPESPQLHVRTVACCGEC